jgi:hypothetical protein
MEISTDGWRQCNAAKFAEAESNARKIVPSDNNNCERAGREQPNGCQEAEQAQQRRSASWPVAIF